MTEQLNKELVYNKVIKAKYKGSNEWIKKDIMHNIRIAKSSENKLYYMLKLYLMDSSPIRMYSYFSEGELRKDWEIL